MGVLNRRPPRAEASVREAESRRDSIGGRRSQRARQQTSLWCSRPALRNTPAIVGLRPTCLRACAHLYLKVGLRWHWQREPRDQEGRIQNNQKSGCWWKPRQHLHRKNTKLAERPFEAHVVQPSTRIQKSSVLLRR